MARQYQGYTSINLPRLYVRSTKTTRLFLRLCHRAVQRKILPCLKATYVAYTVSFAPYRRKDCLTSLTMKALGATSTLKPAETVEGTAHTGRRAIVAYARARRLSSGTWRPPCQLADDELMIRPTSPVSLSEVLGLSRGRFS